LVAANRFLRGLTIILVVLALVLSGMLLIQDARIESIRAHARSVISAASLLLIGVAFLIVQPMMRLCPNEFLKNLLLATSFILWGMVQLMPQSVLSMRLGRGCDRAVRPRPCMGHSAQHEFHLPTRTVPAVSCELLHMRANREKKLSTQWQSLETDGSTVVCLALDPRGSGSPTK
jgi:hypothetical protein